MEEGGREGGKEGGREGRERGSKGEGKVAMNSLKKSFTIYVTNIITKNMR